VVKEIIPVLSIAAHAGAALTVAGRMVRRNGRRSRLLFHIRRQFWLP